MRFYLQVYIHLGLGKILRFTVLILLENVFLKLFRPWHDLIINRPYRTAPLHNIYKNVLFPHLPRKAFFRKRSTHILGGGETLWPCFTENHVGVYLREMGLKLVNILDWVKMYNRIVQWVETLYKNWKFVIQIPLGIPSRLNLLMKLL